MSGAEILTIDQSINHSAVDSSDIEMGQPQQVLLDSIVVEARSRVLKYVPKASRASAADCNCQPY